MKTFIPHNFAKLTQINDGDGRKYSTATGNKYPSVTTVTGLATMDAIMAWRKRVGEKEANRISSTASSRGTTIHSLCEDYIKGEDISPSVFDQEMFNQIKPHLDRIDNVHCLETQLYSDHLEVAGTVDCIAEYDGKLTVIDFKTSAKPKTADRIGHYFMQTAAYAVMFEERTGIPVNRLMIIIGVDEANEATVFHERRDNWIKDFLDLRRRFLAVKGY